MIEIFRKRVSEYLELESIMNFTPTVVAVISSGAIHFALKNSTCFKSFADIDREAENNLQPSRDPVQFLTDEDFSMVRLCKIAAFNEICR